MNSFAAVSAFSVAAALATMTPGLDTALVLRTAAHERQRRAVMIAPGIAAGVLVWGSATAFGLAELLRTSALAFEIVRWLGAAYLVYLGVGMLLHPRTGFSVISSRLAGETERSGARPLSGAECFRRGFLTNLLNPKLGVFYVSFLPQFVPHGAANPRAIMLLFAVIHAVEAIVWFTALTVATGRIAPVLRRGRVVRRLDQAMGTLFIGFGARLAFDKRP